MQVWSLAGRFLGGGHGNPSQYSCQENPMGIRSWGAKVHEVTKNQSWLSTHTNRSDLGFFHVWRLSVLFLKTDFSYELWFKRKLFYLLPVGFPASFHLLWILFGSLWIFILSFGEPSRGTYWVYIMYVLYMTLKNTATDALSGGHYLSSCSFISILPDISSPAFTLPPHYLYYVNYIICITLIIHTRHKTNKKCRKEEREKKNWNLKSFDYYFSFPGEQISYHNTRYNLKGGQMYFCFFM